MRSAKQHLPVSAVQEDLPLPLIDLQEVRAVQTGPLDGGLGSAMESHPLPLQGIAYLGRNTVPWRQHRLGLLFTAIAVHVIRAFPVVIKCRSVSRLRSKNCIG